MTGAGEVVRLERWLAAPPAVVWRYFTEAELWARWQGTAAALEARPGGALAVAMGASTEAGARGAFVALEPPYRLVFTWGWLNAPFGEVPPGSTTVEVVLQPEGDGTRLVLTHSGIPAGLEPFHDEGWAVYLGRLGVVLEGGDPGPEPSIAG